jgi:hypothetical protein
VAKRGRAIEVEGRLGDRRDDKRRRGAADGSEIDVQGTVSALEDPGGSEFSGSLTVEVSSERGSHTILFWCRYCRLAPQPQNPNSGINMSSMKDLRPKMIYLPATKSTATREGKGRKRLKPSS